MKIKKIQIQPATCSLDLGDGSERGFYVSQDYILQKLKRNHRGISLMYTYYPNEKTWPTRASKIQTEKKATGAWDYPYEDYFPYLGGKLGQRENEPFNFMKEIRMHGQEVILTLTIDPLLKKEDIILLAKDLRPYGNILLRVNHECTGSWFCYTKRASYQDLATFFIMVCDVMHEYAPNVKMILCAGMYEEKTGKLEMEDIFLEAHKKADIWSGDNYLSLHWGWPFDIANKDTKNYAAWDVNTIYEKAKKTYLRLKKITGQNKPMVLSEQNADGDVIGAFEQANYLKHFMRLLQNDKDKWLSAFTLYQFRDDGRLGLEITDPNNSNVGIEQPILKMYKEEIQQSFFIPKYKSLEEDVTLPCNLYWKTSDDAEGIELSICIKKTPLFFELYFQDELLNMNLLIEFNGYNFYKAPGVKCIDLMPYFFDHPKIKNNNFSLRIFCPPQNGLNHPEDNQNPYEAKNGEWLFKNSVCLPKLPIIRLEEEPFCKFKKYRD